MLKQASLKGQNTPFCVDLGAVIADIVFILVALFSAQSLRHSLAENPRWFIIGGIVLCAFGVISLIASIRQKKEIAFSTEALPKGNYFFYIAKGFLLNIINIGTFLFWVGLVVFGADLSFFCLRPVYLLAFRYCQNISCQTTQKSFNPHLLFIKIKQTVHIIIFCFGLFFVFQGSFPEQKEQLQTIIEAQIK